MKVQLQRTRTVARRASKAAQGLRNLTSHYVAECGRLDNSVRLAGASHLDLSQHIRGLLGAVSNPVFSAFEEEIDFVSPLPVAQIKRAFEEHCKTLEKQFGGLTMRTLSRNLAFDALAAVNLSSRYANELIRLADEFLADTEDLVRR
ncbi:hypothetical protein [Neorhizobium galegae]|uniref:hypothetical protein n=1 Tax=Neorhizobium galegae TaxID=399 RepID=UPI0021061465|nr:hypothetical protein [Neorhizobium galegae]MCQ1839234.1 hypothetical protein [Neorhizobium galegae]